MPVELEAKMKVNDLDAVRSRLRDAGASRVGSVVEVNAYYDTPGGDLEKGDAGLRLRRERDGESGRERHRVTYKGKQGHGGQLKQREEIETDVSDADAIEAIFSKLALSRTLRFEKRRETWTLDGCEVVLDELPVLGTFVEIEGESESRVMGVRERLGLGDAPLITRGYASLLAEKRGGGDTLDFRLDT